MGTLANTDQTYYLENGDHGNYRYLSLSEIIDSFSATYVGKGKLCEVVDMNDISFHAIRALQELSYDTLKSVRDWEVVVPSTLVVVMPADYVNYVKLAWSDRNGIERIIYPTSKTSNPLDINHTLESWGGINTSTFTDGSVMRDFDELESDEESATWTGFQGVTASDIGSNDANQVDDEYGRLTGGRYGIDPQYAQVNGSFFIDESAGKFHFSSNISGKTLIIKYISDGIASNATRDGIDLESSYVPKLAEEAIYKHILYGVLSARKDTDIQTLMLVKKEKFAETRKAKLRLSNLKLEELTQVLRGGSKQIKH
jgi:hypothetical protein